MNRAQGLSIGFLLLAGLANCKGSEQPSQTTKVSGLVAQRQELMEEIKAQTTELIGKLSCVSKSANSYIIDELFMSSGIASISCSKECLGESLKIFFEAVLAHLCSYLALVEKSPGDAALMDMVLEAKLVIDADSESSKVELGAGGLSMGPCLMSCLSLCRNCLLLPELIENFKAAVTQNLVNDVSQQGGIKVVDHKPFTMTVCADLAKLAHDVLKVIALSREIGMLSQ